MLQGLYVLTDSRIFPHTQWPTRVEAILEGGATVIQLREKELTDNELLPHALRVQEVCMAHDVPLIINDRVELAKKIFADGVHLGKEDKSLKAARDYLGNEFYIGVSCYRDIYASIRAQQLGADYVAFGSLFPTLTKQDASHCPLSIIQKAGNQIFLPICGIGGITINNVNKVIQAGATLLSVSNAIFNSDNPKAATERFTGIMHEFK